MDFVSDLAGYIHFGFGYIADEDGSVIFELGLATGEAILVRLSADAVALAEDEYSVCADDEREECLHVWMALMEIEGENAFRGMDPLRRKGVIFDVA
jgi:hypothetical protein